MFSKACEYGIRASIYIALQSQENKRVSLKDISEKINSPVAFTAKILQLLARNHHIESLKGPTGGFIMTPEKMETVKLSHIVAAIDGDSIYNGCGLGLENCSEENPCPLHSKFKMIRADLQQMLETTSVGELSNNVIAGISFLKN